MRRPILVLLVTFFLAGCSRSVSAIWEERTIGYSHSDWWTSNVASAAGLGFIANAIPGIHMFGLVVDTAFVYSTIDNIVLGNGAIVARTYNCKDLVEDEDYVIFFAWQSEHRHAVERTF